MSTYTYYFLDRDGSIPSFEIAEAANDDEARQKAHGLLRLRPARRAVEVWRDDTCIGAFQRDSLQRAG